MKQHRTRSDSFGLRDKIGYMMGDFGCNMSFQLVSSYAMIYFTQGMGLTLGSWAVIVVLAKIFDAINDPIIGALVDRRKPSKSGKFRPWIFYGSFATLLTTTLFFIDIRALSIADTTDYGILRLIVNDPEKAEAALKDSGLTVSMTNVLGIGIPDEPGGFSRAIRVLADAGISVEYAYAFITPEVGAAYVIIRVENNEDATAVLTKAGIKLIEQNEIFA